MPTPARPRTLLALTASLLGAALLGAAAGPAPAIAQREPPPARVLVLGGGDQASDAAVVAALEAKGLDVVAGPATLAFAGTRQSLREYDVVVALLTGATAPSQLTAAGAQALEGFVEQGGGLVTGEPMVLSGELGSLMPAIGCNSNAAAGTSYTRVTPSAALDEGVAASFRVALTPGAVTESCLSPKDEAAVLYSSSNGGGRQDAAGLVAWNVGKGRVASFSTRIGAAELASPSYLALFQNTVAWMGGARDTTPPTIRSFSVSGAGGLVGERQVQISLTASDSGGSGLGSLFIREYGFSGDPADGWEQDGASAGWQPFAQPGATLTWTLSPKPGVRYIQAFVADRAGNIARAPGQAVVNYAPPMAAVGLDELQIYRISPGAGVATTVRMDVLGGNPDLYVFGPGVSFTPESDGTPEQTSFTAQAGTYQLEVSGFAAGSYSLSLLTGPLAQPGGAGDARVTRRPRISPTAIFPPQPPEDPGSLPTAPVDQGAAGLGETLYLPLLRR